MMTTLFSDGGSRGNPGEAAIGYVIKQNDKTLYTRGELIGIATNNYAEYIALLQGTQKAILLGAKNLNIYMDSELIVKQIKGEYKVKNEELKQVYLKVIEEFKKLESYNITHIKRELNKEADKALNIALDTKEIYEKSFVLDNEVTINEQDFFEEIKKDMLDNGFENIEINVNDDLIIISVSKSQLIDFLNSKVCSKTKKRLIELGYKRITVEI
ncbi:ribonuclease HI [Acetoanaerobium pronyense]|uniref:Ribonuclease HI n=1 Tax=Acetoanaerobium pronyense TaxID=1482736 RepID=A0ABS4KF35_9FIRM|nr:ribonuclease HI family protein [Acetoanaerobium pronyense]MBP2026384.1 ribonuclease HI [Acetoanaerobium pronyense]